MTSGGNESTRRRLVAVAVCAVVSVGLAGVASGVSLERRSVAVEAAASAPGDGALRYPGPGLIEIPEPVRTDIARIAVRAAEQAAASSTELAVAVLDRETGEIAGGPRAEEPYRTASLSKVVVAVDVLDRRRTDDLAVTASDLQLLRRALGPSDDQAMNTLWTRFDGIGAPARVGPRLGLTGTSAPEDPSQWGQMLVPAVDTVRIWQYIVEEMPAPDRDLLLSALGAAPAVARDGFDQDFGLLAPAVDGPGAPGAVAKQGWMCCFSGDYYLHSAGAVGADQRYLVALLTRIPREPGWAAAREEITAIADATVRAIPQ